MFLCLAGSFFFKKPLGVRLAQAQPLAAWIKRRKKQTKRKKPCFCCSVKISFRATFGFARCEIPGNRELPFCEGCICRNTTKNQSCFFTVSINRNSGPMLRPSAARAARNFQVCE